MTDIFIDADETGNLDYEHPNASQYFGIGTATFRGSHAQELWAGFRLRCDLSAAGIQLPNGLHAKNDSYRTRRAVFRCIARQAPRFDSTFLYKANAVPEIRERGQVGLYEYALYTHCKTIVRQVSSTGDTVHLIVGNLKPRGKRNAITNVVRGICLQLGDDRQVVPHIWEAPTSWGIQIADYGLWACQRFLEGRPCTWFPTSVLPTLRSWTMPWGSDIEETGYPDFDLGKGSLGPLVTGLVTTTTSHPGR